MLQNVIKVGNSLGVTLPKDFVVKNKIKVGSKIAVTLGVSKITEYQQTSDKEFFELVKDVEARYGQALDELAKLQ